MLWPFLSVSVTDSQSLSQVEHCFCKKDTSATMKWFEFGRLTLIGAKNSNAKNAILYQIKQEVSPVTGTDCKMQMYKKYLLCKCKSMPKEQIHWDRGSIARLVGWIWHQSTSWPVGNKGKCGVISDYSMFARETLNKSLTEILVKMYRTSDNTAK